ncbi:MAG: hypothetical protein CMH54_10865 [Myxococcales bacterium]|nr:hypothetical protein [Myxococcales bacterium]
MMAIFQRTFRDLRRRTIGFGIFGFLYALMVCSLYPAAKKNAETIQKLMDGFGEGFKKLFGGDDFGTLPGYINGEFFSLIFPILITVCIVPAMAGIVAGEVRTRAIDASLSVPVDRKQFLLARMLAVMAMVGIVCLSITISLELGSIFFDVRIPLGNILLTTIVLFSFGLVVIGVTAMATSLLSSRGSVNAIGALFLVISYLFWVVVNLKPEASALRCLTIFSAFSPREALKAGELIPFELLTLFGCFALSTAASVFFFSRRRTL